MFEFYAIKAEDMTGPEELFGIINTFLQDFEVGGTPVVWCAAAWCRLAHQTPTFFGHCRKRELIFERNARPRAVPKSKRQPR